MSGTDPMLAHAAKRTGPRNAVKKTIYTTASITAGTGDLTAYLDHYVIMSTDQDIRIVFGDADVSAAATTDWLFESGHSPQEWYVTESTQYFRAIAASATATLRIAQVSD